MDEQVLIENGCHPKDTQIAYVTGYGLRIGERAAMLKIPDESCYGQIIALEKSEFKNLYSPPSVADYRPVEIEATLVDGSEIQRSTYLLPESMLVGTNSTYVNNLAKVAKKIGIPKAHIKIIESFARKNV